MSVTVQITPVIAEAFLQRVPLEEALKGFPNYADVLRAAWERIPVERRAKPEYVAPGHEEINLATVAHEDLGLDPYDYDHPLVRKIYEAQADPYPHVPAELKRLKQWVTWSGDTKSKEPYVSGTTRQASTSNSEDLVDYQTAVENIKQGLGYPNLGLVPVAPYLPLDLDSCRNPQTGDIQPWAVNVLNMLPPCYTEITPSGTGLRPWVKMPSAERRKIVYSLSSEIAAVPYKKPQAELLAKNYGTISGQRYGDCPSVVPEVSQEQWAKIDNYLRSLAPATEARASSGDSNAPACIKAIPRLKTGDFGGLLAAVPDVYEGASLNNPEGIAGRNDFVFRTCCKLQEFGWADLDIIEAAERISSGKCNPPLPEQEHKIAARSALKYEKGQEPGSVILGGKNLSHPQAVTEVALKTEQSQVPIIDDPSDDDPRFEMKGDFFDTKVYEDISERFTPYPNPGDGDWISVTANKLVHGTSIPVAFVREPLKAIVLQALDGKIIHPAHPKLSLRGNYFSLAESEGGKTTGLEFAIQAAEIIGKTAGIHFENLFRYKSETTFIRSFTPEGTIKRERDGSIRSGEAGHSSQFLYIKEGNLVTNASDYFAAVFAQLTNLYDQTEAGTESMTNGNFTARSVKVSTVMCFTPWDFKATFGGKGNIGGGGLNRWALVNPPLIHDYDSKDWERMSDEEIQRAAGQLAVQVFNLRNATTPIVLTEELGAAKIRLEVKTMLKKAGKVGKRLLDYFMREQVAQAATTVDGGLVMTTQQAQYAQKWVKAQVECRLNSWPSDANNQIETMEHAIRKAVSAHHVPETKLKDVCHFYREGSGGWFVYSSALKNMVASGVIKPTGKTRKGARTFCPGSCTVHSPVQG